MYKLNKKIPFLMLNFPKLIQQPIKLFQSVLYDFIIIFCVHTHNLFRICFIKMLYFRKFREFSNERNRVERRMEFQKCRFRAMFQTAMVSYLDWITQAGF